MKQLMEQDDLAIVDHADFEWETFADEEDPDKKKMLMVMVMMKTRTLLM